MRAAFGVHLLCVGSLVLGDTPHLVPEQGDPSSKDCLKSQPWSLLFI